MRASTLSLLQCPSACQETLLLLPMEQEGDSIRSGVLTCPGCGRRYAIEQGIARMLPGGLAANAAPADSTVEFARKRSEMAARDAQVEDYDRMVGLAWFGKIEIPVTVAQLDLRREDILLEAGCGTGRMTSVFAELCRSQISVDFSWESLRVCQSKLEAARIANVDLVQADVCALPFRSEQFTRVVSCQVLEHVPTPESRAQMVAELARVAQHGSTVVISAYQHSFFTRLFDRKEGEHAGGIYYYRFDRAELHDLLVRSLDVKSMTGALVYHYLARCQKR